MKGLVVVSAFLLPRDTGYDVAVLYQIEPGWHIYWENSGDTGLATTVSSRYLTKLDYPAPQSIRSAGGMVSFGYKRETVLFAKLQKEVLQIETNWLACRPDGCVPGYAKVPLKAPSKTMYKRLLTQQSQIPNSTLPKALLLRAIKGNTWTAHFSRSSTLEIFPSEELQLALQSQEIRQHETFSEVVLVGKKQLPAQSYAVFRLTEGTGNTSVYQIQLQ